MVTKTEAIKNFLTFKTHSDLAALYNYNMEVQVNVAQDGGERIDDDFKGKMWHGWTDNLTTWKSFRIPYNANTNPSYEDKPITYDLAKHAEGIGMTGWDWVAKESLWVGFDYDAITGHSDRHTKKLSDDELIELEQKVKDIPWVTLRLSTSGRGRHLYIFLHPVSTQNHNEHAALARSILGMLSGITGYDFNSKVDVCGGNLWVWHRKMIGTDGLKLLKQGGILDDIPNNWKEHIAVIGGKAKRTLPSFVTEDEDKFQELSGQHSTVTLDPTHKKLMEWIREQHLQSWWDSDHHMLVTHTAYLQKAHEELSFKGIFKTIAKGTEYGHDHNCFCFPLKKGAWVVRRYGLGVGEAETWSQDSKGWTRCFYNKEPDFDTACKASGGQLNDKRAYVFPEAELALNAAKMIGVSLNIAPYAMGRKCILRKSKDDLLVIEVERGDNDMPDGMKGWLPEGKTTKVWQKVHPINVGLQPNETEVQNFDDLLRHLVTEGNKNCGWVLRDDSDNSWKEEPLEHMKVVLEALGHTPREAKVILGSCVLKSWKIVNRPFQPEYPEGRVWNRESAQLAYVPNQSDDRSFPTWLKILNHVGTNLNSSVANHPWAKANGILTGGDYLKCWIASVLQHPFEQLPYLFLYGDEDCGKSILHESISLLFTRGVARADNALINPQAFNAEIEQAVICVVEETNLSLRVGITYNRIKDWMMAKQIPIHRKNLTPYMVLNSTHWIQTSNNQSYCPVFPGDTRITMIHVPNLTEKIPKKRMIELLKKEAPDFLGELLALEIPEPTERLNVPVIETREKSLAQESNMSLLELFIKENCHYVSGSFIVFKEFVDKFKAYLPGEEIHNWTKIRIGREIPNPFDRGRSRQDNQLCITNMSWSPDTHPKDKLVVFNEKIYPECELNGKR